MGDQARIDFNTLDIKEETITEQDRKDAQPVGSVPVGRYHCTVIDFYGQEMTFMNPPCMGGKIELSINFAIEIDKKDVEGDDVLKYQKKLINDTVPMFTPGESERVTKRRINVADSFGIIPDNGPLKQEHWLELIGKNIVVEYVVKMQKNKETGQWEKTDFNQVKRLGGYTKYEGTSGPLESVSAPATEQPAKSIDPSDI